MACNGWEMDEISQIAKMLTMFHGCICDLLSVSFAQIVSDTFAAKSSQRLMKSGEMLAIS